MNANHATTGTEIAVCWKCAGQRRFGHWSHIKNGICFACHGTGKCALRYWTSGLVVDGDVSWYPGKNTGGVTLNAAGGYSGILNMTAKRALLVIKDEMDFHKSGYGPGAGERLALIAVRLAAVGSPVAWAHAVAYLGGEDGSLLAGMRPGAEKVIAEARTIVPQELFSQDP